MIDKKIIEETHKLINKYIYKTPLQESIFLSDDKRKVYFKNEGLQYTKSFKIRGALSKILRLSESERKKGIITVSSGNHGIAVSYIAKILRIENSIIIVPENTPDSKINKIKKFGSKLIIDGKNYDEAHKIGMDMVKDNNMTYIDAYNKDPLIYAGQGTIGLELIKDNKNIDTILVPIGGGGLITGISSYVKAINPKIKVIGVQTEACPAMKASIDEKIHYKEYPSKKSVCEALIGGIGELSYKLSDECIDDVLIVKEDTIKKAVKYMINKEKIVAEPSSCVPVAAIIDYPDYDFGKEVALIISGNNIDEGLMLDLLNENI